MDLRRLLLPKKEEMRQLLSPDRYRTWLRGNGIIDIATGAMLLMVALGTGFAAAGVVGYGTSGPAAALFGVDCLIAGFAAGWCLCAGLLKFEEAGEV